MAESGQNRFGEHGPLGVNNICKCTSMGRNSVVMHMLFYQVTFGLMMLLALGYIK
jgi:hypothetical protein